MRAVHGTCSFCAGERLPLPLGRRPENPLRVEQGSRVATLAGGRPGAYPASGNLAPRITDTRYMTRVTRQPGIRA
jgi:hypothetical protein